MIEKPQPDPVPTDEPPPHPAEPLQISTPVIHLRQLASGKGMKIEPTIDSDDLSEFARDGEDALIVIEDLEKALRGQLPG